MIFVSTTFLPDKTPIIEAINKCEDIPIYNIELGSNHVYEKDYFKIINGFKNFNFCVHNYFLRPRKDFVVNIASNNKLIREKSLKHIYKSIDFCKKINAKMYTFHPGFLTDPKDERKNKTNYDFLWDQNKLSSANYIKSFENMLSSIEKIVIYSKKKKVICAIETEGSLSKKNHLLMQRPKEFEKFKKYFNCNDIKINVNIGHLNLAKKAFKFKYTDLINIIDKYIVAFEISHNNGIEDQHKPLQKNGWYWNLISDKKFKNCYKILEFRNTSTKKLKNNINLINKKLNSF
ncbi:sugar phosphate isomerase/epimerase [Alphaproteobacteria bacterium]|nr:sugar phosphate isomerase/epimerase [Alphaproteobacteria bacterium]